MTKCEKCGQLFDPNDNYLCPCQAGAYDTLEKLNLVYKIVRDHGCTEPKDCSLHFLAEKLKIEVAHDRSR